MAVTSVRLHLVHCRQQPIKNVVSTGCYYGDINGQLSKYQLFLVGATTSS